MRSLYLAVAVYSLWQHRNNRKFSGYKHLPPHTRSKILEIVRSKILGSKIFRKYLREILARSYLNINILGFCLVLIDVLKYKDWFLQELNLFSDLRLFGLVHILFVWCIFLVKLIQLLLGKKIEDMLYILDTSYKFQGIGNDSGSEDLLPIIKDIKHIHTHTRTTRRRNLLPSSPVPLQQ